MEAKILFPYLLCGLTLILAGFFACFSHLSPYHFLYHEVSSYLYVPSLAESSRVWPDLQFNWRLVIATIIGFTGSAFGTVGGVGGGGIFVPMINLILGFDAKSAAALSKCMIMGASVSSFWYNLQVAHPLNEGPIIDYDLALLFQPMLMLGITIGVSLSVVFPYWLITILIIVLFLGTSSRSFIKGVEMWKQETIMLNEIEKNFPICSANELPLDIDYHALHSSKERSWMEMLRLNIRCSKIVVLILAWMSFLLLQLLKAETTICSPVYWVVNILQLPVALSVFLYEAIKLWKESQMRINRANVEAPCEACMVWTVSHLLICAFFSSLGGIVGGLLGSGGGFILGPLLLEIGIHPEVTSATATFVMMFSSSLSVVEFYFLKRFPVPFALYLMSVSMVAGFWGQLLVRRLVIFLRRASIIVFILSGVIIASALTMGIVGISRSISMINHHDYMGFLSFCEG